MPPDIHSPAFQERFVREAQALANRLPSIRLDLDVSMALTLVGQLQLALRHPGNRGASARSTREFVDRLIDILGQTETLRQGLRAGDDPGCDTPLPHPGVQP